MPKEPVIQYKQSGSDSEPQLSEKIIGFQLKEIQLREKEVELMKNENDYNYYFAKESLKQQSEDNKEKQRLESSKQRLGMIMMYSLIVFFIAFLMTAMLLNKDDILTDIIKIAGYIFGGGVTGYSIRNSRFKDRENNKQTERE